MWVLPAEFVEPGGAMEGADIVDAGRGACGAGFKSLLHSVCPALLHPHQNRYTARPRIDRRSRVGMGIKEQPGHGRSRIQTAFIQLALQLFFQQ